MVIAHAPLGGMVYAGAVTGAGGLLCEGDHAPMELNSTRICKAAAALLALGRVPRACLRRFTRLRFADF